MFSWLISYPFKDQTTHISAFHLIAQSGQIQDENDKALSKILNGLR